MRRRRRRRCPHRDPIPNLHFLLPMPSFVHLVLLRLRPDADGAGVLEELRRMATSGVIKGLSNFSGGPFDSPEGLGRGFTHAFQLTFDSAEARAAYLPHPEHERVKAVVVAALEPRSESLLVFDYAI